MISDRALRAALDQFRLAVAPNSAPPPAEIQVVLDASLSMAAGDGSKEQRARELSILLLKLAERANIHARALLLRGSNRNRVVEPAEIHRLPQIAFDGTQEFSDSWREEFCDAPAPSWRVIISDFLWPGDPRPVVEKAARSVSRSWFIQMLDEWELHPPPAGASALVDVETDQSVELILDETAIGGYIARLDSLRGNMADACRTVGALWISESAAIELFVFCRQHLVPTGLLEEVSA
jgi:hypothetical protein